MQVFVSKDSVFEIENTKLLPPEAKIDKNVFFERRKKSGDLGANREIWGMLWGDFGEAWIVNG